MGATHHGTPTVLYEDNHLLVVDKPAGMATMGAAAGEPSVHQWACRYLVRKYAKPGNAYVGVVSRLDSLVTGVLLLARTSKAAARLAEQFRDGSVEKTYWAIVYPHIAPSAGTCVDWMVKDERQHRMVVADAETEGAQEARLNYHALGETKLGQWLEVDLETGRKHQIRVQLSSRGSPVVGDGKYGSRRAFPSGIALHSRRLVFTHPVRRERLEFTAEPPEHWGRAPGAE